MKKETAKTMVLVEKDDAIELHRIARAIKKAQGVEKIPGVIIMDAVLAGREVSFAMMLASHPRKPVTTQTDRYPGAKFSAFPPDFDKAKNDLSRQLLVKIDECYSAGIPMSRVARALGFSYPTIMNWKMRGAIRITDKVRTFLAFNPANFVMRESTISSTPA